MPARRSAAAPQARARSRRQPPLDRGAALPPPRCRAGTSSPAGSGADGGTGRPRRATRVTSSGDHGPLRAGRVGPKIADDRRADGRGDVRRPGVARHHQRRAARERHEIRDRRRRRQHRGPVRARATTSSPSASSPGPHSTTDVSPCRSRRPAATRAEPRGRPSLVRPRRAGIEQRVAAAGLLADLPRRLRVDVVDRKLRARRGDAERARAAPRFFRRRAVSRGSTGRRARIVTSV